MENHKKWQTITVTDNYARLDSIIGTGLSQIFRGEFARSVMILEEEAQKKGSLMLGRQLAWLLYEHYRIRVEEGAVLEFRDLMNVKIKGDNLLAFQNEGELVCWNS